METFPILFGYKIEEKVRDLRQSGATQIVVALPWELIAPHEKQALINHLRSICAPCFKFSELVHGFRPLLITM